MTQFLPKASSHHKIDEPDKKTEETKTRAQLENQWQEAKALTATIEGTELTDPQVGSKQLLFRLFHEHGVRVFHPFSCVDQCSCSREKLKEFWTTFLLMNRTKWLKTNIFQ